MYLSSFAPATMQGTYCFGHVNVPKEAWNSGHGKRFHVTLYIRVFDNYHDCHILQETHKLFCYAQKQRYFQGPRKRQTCWMTFPDGPQTITTNAPVMAYFEIFAQAFETFLDAEFPWLQYSDGH